MENQDARPLGLVTALGTGDYESVVYEPSGWTSPVVPAETRFPAVAIAELREMRGATAFVLVTKAAREKWYGEFAREIGSHGLEAKPVDILEGRDDGEVFEAVAKVIEHLSHASRVVLDITHSLRHLPFVYFASLAYLRGLKGLEIEAIHYGAFELGKPGDDKGPKVVPIVDLTSVWRLIELYQGLETARETGRFELLARRLDAIRPSLYKAGGRAAANETLSGPVKALACALTAVAPIEAGFAARSVVERATALSADKSTLALPYRLAAVGVAEIAMEIAFDADAPKGKQDLLLNPAEVERELRLARHYFEKGDMQATALVLREWIVNFVLFAGCMGEARSSGWLAQEARSPAEKWVNEVARRPSENLTSDREKELAWILQAGGLSTPLHSPSPTPQTYSPVDRQKRAAPRRRFARRRSRPRLPTPTHSRRTSWRRFWRSSWRRRFRPKQRSRSPIGRQRWPEYPSSIRSPTRRQRHPKDRRATRIDSQGEEPAARSTASRPRTHLRPYPSPHLGPLPHRAHLRGARHPPIRRRPRRIVSPRSRCSPSRPPTSRR